MNVYFVRHGETHDNVNRTIQSGADTLNENGIAQAEVLAKRFSHIALDRIITSPYARARTTAEIINKVIRKELTVSDLVRERKLPTELEGKPIEDPYVREVRGLMRGKNVTDPSWHYSDEDNFEDMKKRSLEFIAYLEGLREDRVLVVTHGTILRVICLCMIFGAELTFPIYYKFITSTLTNNTSITLMQKKEDGWKLAVWNDHMHLGLY